MLISLRFQNIALFGNLEIEFQQGFTVFTGQTGSGKSIFIDTLNSLLPNRKTSLNNRIVENGCSFASIEGVFSISSSTKDWLINQQFDVDEDLIVTREWRYKENKYKSRFRVNGVLVNREQIANLRILLLDFTLQGDAFTLNDSSYQLYLLDCLGLDKVKKSIYSVQDAWKIWTECNLNLNQAKEKIVDSKNEFEKKKYIYEDLEKLNLENPREDINLEIDQNRLSNLLRLQEGIKSLLARLNDSLDQYPTVMDHTNFCINELRSLSKIDSSLQNILDDFCITNDKFYHLICQINDYEKSLDIDPSFLNELQGRLSVLKLYQRKYQKTLPELINYKIEVFDYLSSCQDSNNIEQLSIREKNERENRDILNEKLSRLRKQIALRFEHDLIKSLKHLGMPNVRFKVLFEKCDSSPNGIDKVNFLFSANPGLPLAPLSDIASGGEKSRVLLAIKSIFASFDQTNLLVFDEIDSGVSGSVSTCLAHALGKLSKHRQVFCVTHQPLIAAFADNHFAFKKNVISGQTISSLSNLKEIPDRQKELALLAGGELIEANAYAASLLEHKAA